MNNESKRFLNVSDHPELDFFRFLKRAFWASAIVVLIYFFASVVADLVRRKLHPEKKLLPIPWAKVLINALASSIYAFVTAVLIYIML